MAAACSSHSTARRGLHTHTRRSWARAELAVTVGDPSGQLLAAFQVSHELQRLYAHAHDQADAAHRLYRVPVRCANSTAPELHRLARTLEAWRGERREDALESTDGRASGRHDVDGR